MSAQFQRSCKRFRRIQRFDRVQLQRVSRDAIEHVVAFELELTTDYAGETL